MTRGTGPGRGAGGLQAATGIGTADKAIGGPLERISITSITMFPPSLKSWTIAEFDRRAAKL